MHKYLVLLTDRSWSSHWVWHESGTVIENGSTIKVEDALWEVLNAWTDDDGFHLVFCVRYPKEDQQLLFETS